MKYIILPLCLISLNLIGCDKATDADDQISYNLILKISLPSLIISQDSSQIDIRGGIQTGNIIDWKSDIEISLIVSGGYIEDASGQTDSLGRYSTTIYSINNAADSISVSITATYFSKQLDTTVVTYLADRGLEVAYSTGINKTEAPVFHGYSNDCAGTENNMYEGDCVALGLSPVNWAWGSFSASWEGYVYIPDSGSYTFNSHFWVDGDIYIEVNNTVIADINTPGGGYSKTISIPERNWYPVYMTFASNGGSNNMHLGWTKPGETWKIVPVKNLAHR